MPTSPAPPIQPERAPSRTLLTVGNQKLGPLIGAWSTPAVDSCPGATSACMSVCYAKRYTRRLHIDYSPNSTALRAPDFVRKMVAEAQWKRVVRINVSGDFADVESIQKWAQIARQCPSTTFYAYTRSWRIPELHAELQLLDRLDNVVILYSCDHTTGIPVWMRNRQAVWMALDDQDLPPDRGRGVRVVFRARRNTVMAKMSGVTVCPAENGIDNEVTCQRCRLCFREAF
jgi:hypothetical protein